ncbi:hypothetical protein WJX73_008065 [Symbiochloris irregularis]|uniref:Uncharacterized protein n=1 Tax=Symbiochloris irregularis TaxID=706552 RepID=A0AAW1PEW7_9CHLO
MGPAPATGPHSSELCISKHNCQCNLSLPTIRRFPSQSTDPALVAAAIGLIGLEEGHAAPGQSEKACGLSKLIPLQASAQEVSKAEPCKHRQQPSAPMPQAGQQSGQGMHEDVCHQACCSQCEDLTTCSHH